MKILKLWTSAYKPGDWILSFLVIAWFLGMVVLPAHTDDQEGPPKERVAFNLAADVLQHEGGQPFTEAYHLIVQLENIIIVNGDESLMIRQKMFHFRFGNYQEGLEVKTALVRLKKLLPEAHHDKVTEIIGIVTELTNGTKPSTIP